MRRLGTRCPARRGRSHAVGLATVCREHVRLRRGAIELQYAAKGGLERAITLRDPALHAVVRALLRRKGDVERDHHALTRTDLGDLLADLLDDPYRFVTEDVALAQERAEHLVKVQV